MTPTVFILSLFPSFLPSISGKQLFQRRELDKLRQVLKRAWGNEIEMREEEEKDFQNDVCPTRLSSVESIEF
jgi:hypothetical protein